MQKGVLGVLPFRLSILHVPDKTSMPLLAHTLLKIFLFPPKGGTRFFSMTETETEVSFIMDQDTLELFPPCRTFDSSSDPVTLRSQRNSFTLSVDPQNSISQLSGLEAVDTFWRAVQIYDDSAGMSSTNVLTALSKPLAAAGISIFNLSTYESDYVLVPEDCIYDALEIIQKEFSILTDGLEELRAQLPRHTSHPKTRNNVSNRVHRLTLPNGELHLVGIQKHMLQQVGAYILKLLLFPSSMGRFMSYTETEDEISMMLDGDTINTLPYHLLKNSDDKWGYIKVNDGPLGFSNLYPYI